MHPIQSSIRALLSTPILVCLLVGTSACSVVVGNVRPLEEKSTAYGVMDLSRNDPDWKKLDPTKAAAQAESVKVQDVNPTEVSDVAYQSQSTASIISLDSACRGVADSSNPSLNRDLKTLTNLLLLGITDVTFRQERGLEVQKTPGLETTIIGKLNGEPMEIQTVVLKRQNCVYDLVYMARPQYFKKQLDAFSHFVASLRLRE